MTISGRIGEHYEIVKPLGSGAMGEVYCAVDRKMFGRRVAIKFLAERLTDSEEGRARFRREVETSARLHHPNIITIYDWGEHQGRDYFVMEFVDGHDLQSLLKTGISWDLEQRLDVAYQLADALDFAHRAGVIHRDVKPGNVMVVLSESGPRVKLVDFGIAHVERSNLTQLQSNPGTFAYMSPEQLRSEPLDSRSDLFSLGIVFCELFAGHHPFDGRSDALVSSRILRDEPELRGGSAGEWPPDLELLIQRMLSKNPEQRPATAREVADALRDLLRKAVVRAATADPTVTALDDLERQLVESLVTWARQKESEGALEDALAAYEKAARLARDSERIQRKLQDVGQRAAQQREFDAALQELERTLDAGRLPQARESLRSAWELAPHDPRIAALEARLVALETLSPEDRERTEFVALRMKDVDSALDAGKVDESLTLLSQILRKYPDQADAALMLDRLMQVAAGGIPYGDYRAAVRAVSAALRDGDLEAASTSCGRAIALWPAGPEIPALEAEISSAREEERRRAADRVAAQRRDEADRVRRQHEVLERYLDGAVAILAEARAIEPAGPAETGRALAAFARAVKALDLVLSERPDHPTAAEIRSRVQAEIRDLEKLRTVQSATAPRRVDQEVPDEDDEAVHAQRPSRPDRRNMRPEPGPPAPPSWARLAAAVSIGVVVIALGAFAIWKSAPDKDLTELQRVLGLAESSEQEVTEKLRQVRAIATLLPPGDARRADLDAQTNRLGNLIEMYHNVDWLERLRKSALDPDSASGGLGGIRKNAEYVWTMFQAARSNLEPGDATAIGLEKRGRAVLEEIKNRAAGRPVPSP